MSGPEHYKEAERLLRVCSGARRGSEMDRACSDAARVHAMLADIAARLACALGCMDDPDAEAWREALS